MTEEDPVCPYLALSHVELVVLGVRRLLLHFRMNSEY